MWWVLPGLGVLFAGGLIVPLLAGKLDLFRTLNESDRGTGKDGPGGGVPTGAPGGGPAVGEGASLGSAGELVRRVSLLGAAITALGCLLCLPSVLQVLITGEQIRFSLPWSMPFGSFIIAIDQLTIVFMVPILIVSVLAAFYGVGYLSKNSGSGHTGHGDDDEDGEGEGGAFKRKVAQSWLFYNLLVGSMLLVVMARNGILFLLSWELMALTSFALVLFESGRMSSRKAAWTYLVATHIGTAFILVLFALLGQLGDGSLDFDGFALVASNLAGLDGGASSGTPLLSALFLLAVVGFGTKAGIIPLHVWLPEAHPAAPSHVSALMSGVMIKTGIYGIVRTITFLGAPPVWWGWLLLIVGLVSALLGILMALAQNDVKRMLAYSSVENMGIITMGLGVGMLGAAYHLPVVAAAGFLGAFFHILNHSLFKSLLFFGAGSVLSMTGTRNMEKLGGLLKSAPITGFLFLGGCLAICGLPPFNGFIGEFPIYLGAMNLVTSSGLFGGIGSYEILPAVAGIVAIAVLAMVGGLAAACFARAFGIIFQGVPRSPLAERAPGRDDSPSAMLAPMWSLAVLCVLVAMASPFVASGYLAPAARQVVVGEASVNMGVMGVPSPVLKAGAMSAQAARAHVHGGEIVSLGSVFSSSVGELILPLKFVSILFGVLLLVGGALFWARRRVIRDREVGEAPTWGCGYLSPTPKMQYTSSSFTAPLLVTFRTFLRTRRQYQCPGEYFPTENGKLSSHTPDFFKDTVFTRLFLFIEGVLAKLRWVQHGRLHFYILYIFIALVILFVWKLR